MQWYYNSEVAAFRPQDLLHVLAHPVCASCLCTCILLQLHYILVACCFYWCRLVTGSGT